MWTEKTKNGKYKHVERYTDPITGKEKKGFCYDRKKYRTSQKVCAEGASHKNRCLTGCKDCF